MEKLKKIIQILPLILIIQFLFQGCQVKTVNRDTDPSQTLRPSERQDLTYLENKMRTQKEKDQYSRIVQWFEDDQERREFLLLNSFEDRQKWIQDHKMWDRSNSAMKTYQDALNNKDIAIGMPMEFVQKAWGEPDSKEISGMQWYKNEKWKYAEFKSTPAGYRQVKKSVFFERGKVIGWETE